MPKQKKYYYHITSFEGWLAIKEKGLRCSFDGYIYLLDTDRMANYVAYSQLGKFQNYGLYRVDPEGINAEFEQDKVGEITTKQQFMVKQPVILPKYLKDMGMFTTIPQELDPETMTLVNIKIPKRP